MEKINVFALIGLVLLTLLTSRVSQSYEMHGTATVFVLLLAAFKFLIVAFQFMELKKAHKVWQWMLLGFISSFVFIVLMVLC